MKNILVTGASGGMGRATISHLAKGDCRVFALDRVPCEANENVIPIVADLTDPDSVTSAFERIKTEAGELHAVIHLAGIYLLDSLVEISPEDFERAFRVNLGCAFLVNKTFLPLLSTGAKIVHVTSELAVRDPLPFTGLYAITKAALDRYCYSLRMELQLKDISVSVLRAGAVDTGMIGASTAQLDAFCRDTKLYSCNAKRFRRIVDSVEAKRIPPERIAKKLAKILAKRKPRFAYAINRNPLLILFDILPKRLRFSLIRNILKDKKEISL